jgi:hypothetical protein
VEEERGREEEEREEVETVKSKTENKSEMCFCIFLNCKLFGTFYTYILQLF